MDKVILYEDLSEDERAKLLDTMLDFWIKIIEITIPTFGKKAGREVSDIVRNEMPKIAEEQLSGILIYLKKGL
ncbi:MAG: hypothetical protein A2287_08375 [Candidatus Melainabacteria bacterium RIFOXYA12_FULL_32_12]|nr:MAG: hypothetical protein A2287_08375 [Candidatus Melainabacteria bacterium RIFOXYA12_FULL_32_12]